MGGHEAIMVNRTLSRPAGGVPGGSACAEPRPATLIADDRSPHRVVVWGPSRAHQLRTTVWRTLWATLWLSMYALWHRHGSYFESVLMAWIIGSIWAFRMLSIWRNDVVVTDRRGIGFSRRKRSGSAPWGTVVSLHTSFGRVVLHLEGDRAKPMALRVGGYAHEDPPKLCSLIEERASLAPVPGRPLTYCREGWAGGSLTAIHETAPSSQLPTPP